MQAQVRRVAQRRAKHLSGPLLAAALIAGLAVGAVLAADDRPGDHPGRFTLSPVEGGILRLDTETGATSMCARKNGIDSCTLLPESETALRQEIDRLKSANARLEAENQGLKDMLAMGAPKAADNPPTPDAAGKLPTARDIDKGFDYLEGLVKKFRERMKRLERPEGTPL